jgi:hypothetical protein
MAPLATHALIDFESAAGADGDDFVTANGAVFEGLDWTNPAQVPPFDPVLDSNAWTIDTDGSPFGSAGGGTVWLRGFAQGQQNRTKVRMVDPYAFAFRSVEVRTRFTADPAQDGNLDGVDDRWLTTLTIRFRDVDDNESLAVVALDAADEWMLVQAGDAAGSADMTRLKAIFFEGDSGTSVPGTQNDRFAIDNLVLFACANGLDDDGDGATDVGEDVGCAAAASAIEDPQCQDGINNDPGQDSRIDWDGGASAGLPVAQQTAPDLQCSGFAWIDRERAKGCGLGFEVVAALVGLAALRRRRRARRTG